MHYIVIIIVAAFILDLIFGDPYWLPHPICLIGKFISIIEKMIRTVIRNEVLGGLLLVIIVTVGSFGVPFIIIFAAGKISLYLVAAIQVYFCYQIFAVNSLRKESMKVYEQLKKKDLNEARKYLSYIVGRDTQELSDTAVIKATVETIAENTTDGVVAPLIFMAIGGCPLAFLYKSINTMDSMVGYKNDKYINFGRCAAKLDDIANFIPARITAVMMIIASFFLKLDHKNAFKIFKRDRYNHKSPNSAQTESVCAGALGVQLAGDASYFGKIVHKKTIGDSLRKIEINDIVITNRLMYVTATLSVILISIILEVILWLA